MKRTDERNERTSARVAKIAGKILAVKGNYGTLTWDDDASMMQITLHWKDIRALAASCLTQSSDHSERDIIRKGDLPDGHRVIKRHKAITRNGKVRG